jgi:hypothetical protein
VLFVGVAVLASVAQQAVAGGQTVEGKRAEAARLTNDLASRAGKIFDLDRRWRQSQARLADVQESLRQAETGMRSATQRQEEARRRMQVQAVDAYTRGGSATILGKRLRANSNLAVYDTYLSLVAGMDRSAVEGLRGAREDLAARQQTLNAALDRAKTETGRIAADKGALVAAEDAQRAALSKVNGELATLVAAEQARRTQLATPAPVRAAAVAPASPSPTAGGPAPAPAKSAPSSGKDPWACIRQLESGNNYRSPGGGAYQFTDDTWHSLGYTGSAQDYPPDVQDAAARQLQAREGWGPWTTAPLCGLL